MAPKPIFCDDSDSESTFEVDGSVWDLHVPRGPHRFRAFRAWAGPPTSQSCTVDVLRGLARKLFREARSESFWVPADGLARDVFEKFALDIFWFHLGKLGWSKRAVAQLGRAAGAEYWVQRRTASMPKCQRSINWHFDKDEDLFDAADLTVHPLVSTVTYLSCSGAPLVVLGGPTLEQGPDSADLVPVGAREKLKAYMVFPEPLRHVAFRGNLLHGCPSEFEKTRGERLSLLVNVWVHHRPLNLRRRALPASVSPLDEKRSRRVIRVGRKLRVVAATVKSDDSVDLRVNCASWTLSGLRLPLQVRACARRSSRDAADVAHTSSGILAVQQVVGQPRIDGSSTARRQEVALKRKAAAAFHPDSLKKPAGSPWPRGFEARPTKRRPSKIDRRCRRHRRPW